MCGKFMQTTMIILKTLVCSTVLMIALLSACSTIPQSKPETSQEKFQREVKIGLEMSNRIDREIHIKQTPSLNEYLDQLSQKLLKADPSLRDLNSTVLIIDSVQNQWRNFGLPGNRIYLAASLIKKVSYENELIAFIALELAHVMREHAINKMLFGKDHFDEGEENPRTLPGWEPPKPGLLPIAVAQADFFGPKGILTFSPEANEEAIESAYSLMYHAGVDPRGLMNCWKIYLANEEKSPYDSTGLEKLVEKTRRVIADSPPLRNPILSSREFLKVKKSIQTL